MDAYTKALRVIGAVLTIYVLLVATHRGEFWPFSIYPMFSQAGDPWTRAIMRKMPDGETPSWKSTSLQTLPGEAFPVQAKGINQNDVANYVSKTEQWTRQRLQGLRNIFGASYDFSPPLLVMKVRGKLVDDSVRVTATPLILFTTNTARLNPSIAASPDSANRSPPTGSLRE